MDPKSTKQDSKKESNSHFLYPLMFSSLPDFVYILDKECSCIRANQNLMDYLELNIADTVSPDQFYQILESRIQSPNHAILGLKSKDMQVMSDGRPSLDKDVLSIPQSHSSINQVQFSRMPLIDANGLVLALMVIGKDITTIVALQDKIDGLEEKQRIFDINIGLSASTAALQSELEHPLSILLVEDNIIAQKAAQNILKQIHCSVDVVNTETQLMSIFQPGKYDLIFMDIGLEETSGYMLAKHIRSLEVGTDFRVPIVALTGYKAEMLISDCGYYQIEGAITKPLTIEQAQQLIQRYVFHVDIAVKGLELATKVG